MTDRPLTLPSMTWSAKLRTCASRCTYNAGSTALITGKNKDLKVNVNVCGVFTISKLSS